MPMLAIVIVAALGASQFNMILALSIAQIPTFARVMRGQVLTVRDTEYISFHSYSELLISGEGLTHRAVHRPED